MSFGKWRSSCLGLNVLIGTSISSLLLYKEATFGTLSWGDAAVTVTYQEQPQMLVIELNLWDKFLRDIW